MTTDFSSMPSRLHGELDERTSMAARAIAYHVAFLDDYLRGILPHDLILIGAPTGIGKTDLALSIAASNARRGKHVHYLALEAEPAELERRTKYAMLARLAHARNVYAAGMNYSDWLLGRCEEICAPLNDEVDREIKQTLSTLFTFYRGAKFDAQDMAERIVKIHRQTDLIVIDHLHYVDSGDDENENRALGDTVKTIRDISLRIGKPIIVVAHLRKRDMRLKQLIASLDDFHGSSNITKICTQAITIERAHDVEAPKWYYAPTYMAVLKDRRAGAPGLVACVNFDRRLKSYANAYTLGRVTGSKWEPLKAMAAPSWARHHVAMTPEGPSPQAEMRVPE